MFDQIAILRRVGASTAVFFLTLAPLVAINAPAQAADSGSAAFAWGFNGNGELGNNSWTDSLVPVAVDTSAALLGEYLNHIEGGLNHTVALADAGGDDSGSGDGGDDSGSDEAALPDTGAPVGLWLGVLGAATIIAGMSALRRREI